MSQQQYPPHQPQPGWGGGQPVWGAPPPPPQPPKKRSIFKVLGLGCAGVIGLFVVIGIVAAMADGVSSGKNGGSSASGDSKAKATAPKDTKPATDGHARSSGNGSGSKSGSSEGETVVFKVWGTAPAGALGPLDITYGSDSDNRKGTWENGQFTATLPLNKKAMYYSVNAQLQGSGDIHCSVTVDGHTKSGHASGGYNICDAQLSSGLFGGWD